MSDSRVAVSALAPLAEKLTEALPAETPSSFAPTPIAPAAGTAALRAAAVSLLDWSEDAMQARDASAEQLDAVEGALDELELAIAAAARSVSVQATAALAAAARERRLQDMREKMAPPPLQNLVCYWDDLGGNYCFWE